MAFSYAYANYGGSGDRTTVGALGIGPIVVTSDLTISGGGAFSNLCDGGFGNNTGDSFKITSVAVSGKNIKFDFSGVGARTITEFKFYQDTSDTHGVWDLKGSLDDSAYTTIQANITLGGSTTQTQTIGAPAKYLFYKFVGVSGNTSATPFLQEFEFKISGNALVEAGDRTATAAASTTFASSGGTVSNFIDGSFTNDAAGSFGFTTAANTGKILKVDFGSGNAFRCTGFTWWQQTADTHGTFDFSGSNDDSAWTVLKSGFTLGGATPVSGHARNRYDVTNLTAFRYYRIIGTGSNSSGTPWNNEWEFEEEIAGSNADGALASAGTGAATFVGSTLADGTFTMAGVAAFAATGAQMADGVVTMAGSASMTASPVVTPAARKAMVIIICG